VPTLVNHFASAAAAARYAHGRPDVHRGIARRIGRGLRLSRKVDRALDMGCGTGLSARALGEMAELVIGADLSAAMIAQAARAAGPLYVVAAAEALPFAAGPFDLITCGLAFHWFDRAEFLAEARRVLKPGGFLVVYDHWFAGRMRESAVFEQWHRSEYLSRYPAPPRKGRADLESLDPSSGFRLEGRDDASEDLAFSARQLSDYLLTQSNVSAAVEQQGELLEDVAAWLARSARSLTPEPTGHFEFESSIWFLARA